MFAAISVFISFIVTSLYMLGLRTAANADVMYIVSKALCSAVFVTVGVIAFARNKKHGKYGLLLLISIMCGMAGDVLLALSVTKGNAFFISGLAMFFADAVLIVISLYQQDGFNWLEIVIAAVLSGLSAWLLLSNADLGALTVPVLVYMAAIMLAAGKAVSVGVYKKLHGTAAVLLICGVLLWMLSDVALALEMFIDVTKLFKAISPLIYLTGGNTALDYINGFSYFIGQTMIATSIMYSKKES